MTGHRDPVGAGEDDDVALLAAVGERESLSNPRSPATASCLTLVTLVVPGMPPLRVLSSTEAMMVFDNRSELVLNVVPVTKRTSLTTLLSSGTSRPRAVFTVSVPGYSAVLEMSWKFFGME